MDLNFISIAMFVFGGASSVTGAVASVVVMTPGDRDSARWRGRRSAGLDDGCAAARRPRRSACVTSRASSSSSGPAADHSAANFLRPSARCKHARDARSRDLHDLNATRQNARQAWTARDMPESYRMFCGTTPEHMLFGLRASLGLLFSEGPGSRLGAPSGAGGGHAGG